MAAPKPLGKWGFELALDQMQFTVEEHDDAWNDTFAHPDAYHELGSDLSFPKVRVRLGITDRMDVGAYYTENPNANYGWAGVDLSYSVMQQSETTPIHLAVRGAYTMTLYVADMDMHTLTADVAAGHTLWNYFTPYLGVGGDIVAAQERTNAVALEGEGQFVPRAFGGVEASIWHAAVGAEAEVGALNRLEFKVSAVF
jgi:hypothetical protein